MTNKKQDKPLFPLSFDYTEGEEPVTKEEPLEPVKEPEPVFNPYYQKREWMMGVRQVYHCNTCGTDRDDEDAMIEHAMLHFPKSEQEEHFNAMLAIQAKTKEN